MAEAAEAAEEDVRGEAGAVADSGTGADEDDCRDDTRKEDEEDVRGDDSVIDADKDEYREDDEEDSDDADEEAGPLPRGRCDVLLLDGT